MLCTLRCVCAACVVVLSTVCVSAPAQTIMLSGKVTDSRTHLPVDAAVVSMIETRIRCCTDTSGGFRFMLPGPGRCTIAVRRIGYAACERIVAVTGDAGILIELSPVTIQTDEVIVRSTRLQSDITTSPIPFSVVTAEEIALHPSLTVPDVMRSIAGVSLVRDGSWETAVSIRGMSRSNIVMLVDNTRIETANDVAGALSLVDVHELERIETVKSPGSSIWGTGGLGGVVHMMTKQPSFSETPDSHLQLDEGVSSVNGLFSHHLAFDHSSPRIGFRLGLGYRKAGNTQTPDGAIVNSQFTDFTLSASAGVKTFNAQMLCMSYQRSQAEDAGIPGGAAFAEQARARYTLARREMAAAEYTIPDVSRTVDLMTFRVSRQLITRNVEIIQTPALTLTPHAVHGTTSAQAEARLQPQPGLTLTAGSDVWQRSLESRRERVNSVSQETIGERPVPASSFLSAGSYIHGVWKISPDRVTLDAGARYDWIRVHNETTFNPEYVIESGGIPDRQPPAQILLWNEQTVYNRSWSADAGITYALSPAADISCLVAAAFRSPSLEERFQYIDLGSSLRVGNPLLKPEQSTSLNAGIGIHGGRTAVRADFFINRFADLVAEVPGLFATRAALIKTNIGEALMYGGEIAGEVPLLEWAYAHCSLAYVYGEDTRANAPLPQIPPLTGVVSLNAAIPRAGMVAVGASYALRQDRIAVGESETPGYVVIDVDCSSGSLGLPFFSHAGAACTLRGGIGNVFNASYRIHLSTLRGLVTREPGRNLYLSASVTV